MQNKKVFLIKLTRAIISFKQNRLIINLIRKVEHTLLSSLAINIKTLNHSFPYLVIKNIQFRIQQISVVEDEKQDLSITAYQMVETLFDSEFVEIGGSEWVEPDIDPIALTKIRV